jgi:hypothetical protein
MNAGLFFLLRDIKHPRQESNRVRVRRGKRYFLNKAAQNQAHLAHGAAQIRLRWTPSYGPSSTLGRR